MKEINLFSFKIMVDSFLSEKVYQKVFLSIAETSTKPLTHSSDYKVKIVYEQNMNRI
jgi:hypothetical protein